MASIFSKSLKGVAVPHKKNTQDSATKTMPVPDKVSIVMAQHMGPPCEVQVKVGDQVKVGQVIGDTGAFLSAPVHSSVSGTVKGIEEVLMPNGARSKTVIIETDKLQTLDESVVAPVITDKNSFIAAVRASGLVGLGGAGFPTHIKFNPKQTVDHLLINAAECEPYITSDYRTIMEEAENVLFGIREVMKHLGIPKCIIGVEDNKPKGIQKLEEMLKGDSAITVKALKSQYPQGGEKVLIYETTGRVMAEGKLPADVGVIVSNITSIAVLGQYLKDGVPLISKRLTVDGGAIANPQNVKVLIGTSIKDLMEFCGGYKTEPKKILYGGPMMGTPVHDDSYPILKNNNAILAFDKSQVEEYSESACIRCGRCVRACPMNLMPLRIEDCFNREDMEGLAAFKVNLCMECGCCAFACPAKRHLVQMHRLAKGRLRNAQMAAQAKAKA